MALLTLLLQFSALPLQLFVQPLALLVFKGQPFALPASVLQTLPLLEPVRGEFLRQRGIPPRAQQGEQGDREGD